jgi:hypothetical protein
MRNSSSLTPIFWSVTTERCLLANPEIKRLSCRRRNMFVTGKSDLAIGPTSHSRRRKKLRTRLSNRQIFGDPKMEENFLNQVMLPKRWSFSQPSRPYSPHIPTRLRTPAWIWRTRSLSPRGIASRYIPLRRVRPHRVKNESIEPLSLS